MKAASSPAPPLERAAAPIRELVILTLARLSLNMAQRMVYPFMPAISRGLGVPMDSARYLISARSLAGFASPVFGPLSDRVGRKAMLLLGMALLFIALLLVPIAPTFSVVFLAFVLFGLAKSIYDPVLQAYVGDRVAYRQRGLAIGFIELSWSGALLLGAPLIGFSIERFGWSSPFVGLALFSGLSTLAILFLVRREPGEHPARAGGQNFKQNFAVPFRLLLRNPAALSALTVSFLVHVANESLFVVYGEWMEGSFNLRVGVLGLLTAIVAVAELAGELLVLARSDRIGKRRLALLGFGMSAVAYAVFPWLSHSLPLALAVLFVMFVSWEAGIVASISLITELLPAARGAMMSANVAFISTGRVVGALLGGWLWTLGSFTFNGFAAAVVNVLGILLLLLAVREAPSS
jgi:predicted MFS family arabinose efflux permease